MSRRSSSTSATAACAASPAHSSLVKLGFYFDRMVLMPDDKDEVKLFARSLGNASV